MKKIILLVSIFLLQGLVFKNTQAAITYEEFKELKVISTEVFDILKPGENYSLNINKQPTTYTNPDSTEEQYWWKVDILNASFFKTEKNGHTNFFITVFGGFAKQEFMDADALAVTLCHEMAHGLGGLPVKNNGTTSEGQADYYATKECLPVFFDILKAEEEVKPRSGYIIDLCSREDRRGDLDFCVRAMNALHADMKFFELLGGFSTYNDSSSFRAIEFNANDTYYPDAQCRVDIMIHGILDVERPNCFDPYGIDRIM